MRRFRSLILILLLVVVHAPSQAQALLFLDFLPTDLLPFGTNEPVMLLLTGLALIALGRIGSPRRVPAVEAEPAAVPTSVEGKASVKSPAPDERAA